MVENSIIEEDDEEIINYVIQDELDKLDRMKRLIVMNAMIAKKKRMK